MCKGSCREATEGLCGTIFRVGKCIGEKVLGNDFAVESTGFDGTSAKWGQNGHGTFGRWAHREVCYYNPSVSFADSSPYTGEPLPCTASAPLAAVQTALQIPNLSVHCGKPICTIIIYNFCLYFPAIQDYNAVRKMPCRAGAVPERARRKKEEQKWLVLVSL